MVTGLLVAEVNSCKSSPKKLIIYPEAGKRPTLAESGGRPTFFNFNLNGDDDDVYLFIYLNFLSTYKLRPQKAEIEKV